MVGNHRTITQTATDDLSRGYGGVYSVYPDGTHPHQATTIFSPATSVTASTGFVPNLASPSKGEPPSLISSNGNGGTPNFSSGPITTPGGSTANTVAWQLRDPGSKSTTGVSGSGILEEKRKRKCWEVESGTVPGQGAGPKVAIATPTMKKTTVPVALTSPTSRRTLSPVAGQDLDQVISSSKKQETTMSTTSSLRAIRPCKTSEPNTTSLPITSTTTSGIPVGIAVARQRCTSASQHVTVTNTATTSYPDLNGMTAGTGPVNGLTTSQSMGSMATATSHGLMTATGHGMQATMGNGQCLPAMTLLTCDDGNSSNGSTTAWASPWHYPIPQIESQMPQLSQPSNLQLVRDPATGQFLLLPTASFDSMPRTVMWPAPAQGHPAPHQLILPQAGPPPLILDNRLVALTTPAPPQQQDKTRRGGQPVQHHQQQQATLVKLEDTGSITGVMMPPTDYSKATHLGSDTNSGYAVIHHPSSFINPNYSAISSSTGSFFIQHISRNNANGPATMTMSPAPTLFNANTGPRTNNLLISAQQLPSVGTQQLTLAPSTGDLKTFCYSDNLYHNTTTTTMYNLQQTTSVVNQQTSGALSTSTQQMSTTSILVNNDKMQQNTGTNATLCAVETEPNIATASYENNQQQVEYQCNTSESSSNQLECEVNEDSQTSVRGNEEDEDEEEEEDAVRMKNDAGNQTDMPDEPKEGEKVDDGNDETGRSQNNETVLNSQHESVTSVQNDISDMPMSLNHGNKDESEETLRESEESESSVVRQSLNDANQTPSTLYTEQRFETESNVVRQTLSEANQTQDRGSRQTPSTLDTEQRFGTGTSEQIICDKPEKVSKDTLHNLRKQDSHTNSSVDSSSKDNVSPESKKKLKQMPPLYPIHSFLPVINDPNNKDQRLVGFRSMPMLEDELKVKTSDNKIEDLTVNSPCEETRLAVNALIGLSDKRNELEGKESTICDTNNFPKHVEVKPIPRFLSVSNLLDKNFSTKYNRKILQQKDVKGDTIAGQSNIPDSAESSSETALTSAETQDNSSSSDGGTDEILEVANILCSGLFTSGGSGKSHQNISSTDVNKACDTVQQTDEDNTRKLSECSAESGVDLSGLELLSISIEHLEKKDHACDQEDVRCHKDFAQQDFNEDAGKDESSLNDSGISRGLDLLCALAHERFLEEKSPPSPHPSSSSVRESSMSPALLKAWNSHQRQTSSPSPSKWMLSSDTDDEMFVQPYKPRPYKRPAGVPYKEVSHTYRSAKSEQETRRVLASKQTYHYVPPTSIDLKEMETRKLLAEIQREFREAQKELSRLTPKKSPAEKGPTSSGPDLGSPWKSGASEANLVAGNGNVTPTLGVKRKPGRPRKAEKESVESLKHSGKKVRDMINDTPPSPKDHPRPKLSLSMSPATPSEAPALQAKFQLSPPVLTPFSPLDQGGDCTPLRPPTLHVGGSSTPSGVARAPPTLVAHSVKKQQQHGGGSYYKRQLTMDDDSEDSDAQEPPELSPESQQQVAQSSGCRKRGRPPKKLPEPPTTPDPVKKPVKPTFVSIILANKNKQAAKPAWDDDVKPNKIRPKLKAEAKVKTNHNAASDSEDEDLSDLEDTPSLPVSITVRKPSLVASSTHVKKIKPVGAAGKPITGSNGERKPVLEGETGAMFRKSANQDFLGGEAQEKSTPKSSCSIGGDIWGRKKVNGVDGNDRTDKHGNGRHDKNGSDKHGNERHDKNSSDKHDKNVLGKKSHSLDASDRHHGLGKKSSCPDIGERHVASDKHAASDRHVASNKHAASDKHATSDRHSLGKKVPSQEIADRHIASVKHGQSVCLVSQRERV
uniref:Uncharacterized protein n=1 Tax=Cacopsylla melanoneura TaxID=428564 RepID=A0A8D8S213_9HEMI